MEIQKIVPEYYSKNILVRKLFLKRLRIGLELASQVLKLGNNLKVIDLGCGDGTFLKLLESEFPNIATFGIDIIPEVATIKEFLRAEIKIGDLKKSGFPDRFFDVVFCFDVLEHFQDLREPVEEIKRIMKDNGLLIISMPTENYFYKLGRLLIKGTTSMEKGPWASPHFHNSQTIIEFISANGFKTIKKVSLPFLPFFKLFDIASFKKY